MPKTDFRQDYIYEEKEAPTGEDWSNRSTVMDVIDKAMRGVIPEKLRRFFDRDPHRETPQREREPLRIVEVDAPVEGVGERVRDVDEGPVHPVVCVDAAPHPLHVDNRDCESRRNRRDDVQPGFGFGGGHFILSQPMHAPG